ncbi:hypothetical protein GCM10023321_26740 [Pseudonocardia eucalypti]|uniref:DUF4333 domain-containing protein n=1 Tax=Pseudonocardia eucalypti TaxID=648755 RepID=A0ABP9Q4F3_9PSEU|nr:hypothetical protein [Pseudonocardia eucalypti]
MSTPRYPGPPRYGPHPPPAEATQPVEPAGLVGPVGPANRELDAWLPVPGGVDSPTDPALRPVRRSWATVPGWLLAVALAAVVGVVGVLGFVKPGYFVARVLDQASVQDGVRSILRTQYHLPGVTDVACPSDQPVQSGLAFDCTVTLDGRTAAVTVLLKDDQGGYEVSRPR